MIFLLNFRIKTVIGPGQFRHLATTFFKALGNMLY